MAASCSTDRNRRTEEPGHQETMTGILGEDTRPTSQTTQTVQDNKEHVPVFGSKSRTMRVMSDLNRAVVPVASAELEKQERMLEGRTDTKYR